MRRPWTGVAIPVAFAMLASPISAGQQNTLGEVDFFGHKGLDVGVVRTALPFHEGQAFPPAGAKSSEALKRQVNEQVKRAIGLEPTDVSFVCCNAKQGWSIYIGLPGQSYRSMAFNPVPAGAIRLPKAATALRKEMDDAFTNAVMRGRATEDDSEGYTLTNEPRARKAQLAIRDYALHNETLIQQVLASSSDAGHRAMAAQMMGYGRQSASQIAALVAASLDSDDGVRNDAVRALWTLAGAKPDLAKLIPPEPFIRLLRSGSWSDHNKASLLLVALTKQRDAPVLAQLREEALDALAEMARWRNQGHAEAALVILGRIAQIEESALMDLISAGQTDRIFAALKIP